MAITVNVHASLLSHYVCKAYARSDFGINSCLFAERGVRA